MLMTPSTALLDQLLEDARNLKHEIMAHTHELPEGKPAYYISPNGNDANDGRSPEKAWKTLDALHAITPEPGSEVLFECGGIWRGQIEAQPGVTYASYGFGEKPKLYGSPLDGAKIGHWREVAPDIWRYSRKMAGDVGGIVFDGGRSHAIKLICDSSGEQVVDVATREPFTGWRDLKDDLTFFHDVGENQVRNESGAHVYLCSKEGDPAKRFNEIEFLARQNNIRIMGNGVTIDNLCIMYCGCHGIGSGTTSDLTVTYCELGWIGGSIQFYRNGRPTRFGNGIEIYGGCNNYRIDHCYVYQIYDAGITHQYSSGGDNDILMNNVVYTKNLIEYCTYSIEYFLGRSDNPDAKRLMDGIVFRGNILRYAGFGWGDQRPDKTQAAHIKSWDHENNAVDFTIEDNVMISSRYMMLHIGARDYDSLPIMRSNCLAQYVGAELGRFSANPTKNVSYISQNVSRDEFVGNEFYLLGED